MTLNATKKLTGRNLTVGEFEFAVRLADGDDVLTANNAADGSVSLGTLRYSAEYLAQLVENGSAKRDGSTWTIPYVAYEKTDGLTDKGVTAQTQPVSFTVTVTDDGKGALSATANLPEGGLVFENTYATEAVKVGVSGVKVLSHADGLSPNSIAGKFTFTIASDDANAPLPSELTATNDEAGNVDFGQIEFTLDDLNRALGVTEEAEPDQTKAGETAEVKADETKAEETTETKVDEAAKAEETAKAEVEEGAETKVEDEKADAEVQLLAEEEPGEAAEAVTEPVPVAPEAAEPVADSEPVAVEPLVLLDTPVVSELTATDDANNTEVKTASFSAKNASETQPVDENAEAASTKRSYTFVYTVTETGSVAGVTNDAEATKTVRIKVTDDGQGKLTAEVVRDDESDPAFTFTNTYDVTPTDSSVTDQIAVTKSLTGRDMCAGEFAFELLEGNEVVALGSNDADGTVSMAPVTYTEPGTHRYTLREVGGGAIKNGVTYDAAAFQIVTVVADNGEGGLTVTHRVVDDKDVVFANSYEAKPTSVVIGASKVLTGADLKDGQFTFKLVGKDVELSATNDAEGTVVFDAIDFAEPGTYEFDVYEVNDGQTGVSYDEAKRHVTVTVTDDGLGNLVAEVAGDDAKALTFTNTYTEHTPVPTPDPTPTPEPTPTPDPTPTETKTVVETTVVEKTVRKKVSTPYTGDQIAWTAAALLGTCALVFVAAALALKRARK